MSDFATYESEGLAPGWLQGYAGKGYLAARGSRKDAFVQGCREAVKARFPGVCPSDALPYHGRDRLLDQGPGETEASYRARLLAAWETWAWAGTAYGVLLAFWWSGYRPSGGNVVLQTQSGKQYQFRTDFDPAVHAPEEALITTDLGTIHLGGAPSELWSDMAVLFTDPMPAGWIGAFPGDNSAEVNHIRRIIVQWKPAHCRCVKLIAGGGELWGYPTEVWATDTETYGDGTDGAVWTPPAG